MKRAAWLPALLFAAGIGAWSWWTRMPAQQAPVAQAPGATGGLVAAPPPAASAPRPEDGAPPPEPLQALADGEVPAALDSLLGGKAVAKWLRADGFARHFVATVDNLGRSHAPAESWPVHPAAGRFSPDLDNAARYTPLVLLAESVDAGLAADFYIRLYPLLQREYRQLGFPEGQFHRRLREAIALLLSTPEPRDAPQLMLTEVKGPMPSERPWVHYRFADPALEELPSGQKILLRVGVVNERRLKKKLAEFRDEVDRRVTRQATAAASSASASSPR